MICFFQNYLCLVSHRILLKASLMTTSLTSTQLTIETCTQQREGLLNPSQRPSTTPGTGEASAIQLTSDPTRPALPSNQAMIMSSGNEAQEVTQKCPMPDCQWTSYKTTDSSMLDACIKQLCLHVQLEHEMSASSPMTGGSGR